MLDGQQRLNALFIGLQGSYADRKRWARKGTDNEYPERELYWNVLAQDGVVEEEEISTFRFLTAEDALKTSATACCSR